MKWTVIVQKNQHKKAEEIDFYSHKSASNYCDGLDSLHAHYDLYEVITRRQIIRTSG